MSRFLIEIPHESDHTTCVRALDAISRYGSHLITHAYWGCANGHHCGHLVVEVPSREDALRMVPPQFRSVARVVEVQHFTREFIEGLMAGLAA